MKGTRIAYATWGDNPPLRMPPGRVCARDGCGTRLSVYNPQPFCGLHAGAQDEPVPEGYVRCRGTCGRVLPWTPEFFHRDGSTTSRPPHLHRSCKHCRNRNNRKNRKNRRSI